MNGTSGGAARAPRKLGLVLIVCFVVTAALSWWLLGASSGPELTMCHPIVYHENGVYRSPDPARGCRLSIHSMTRDQVGESFRGRHRKH